LFLTCYINSALQSLRPVISLISKDNNINSIGCEVIDYLKNLFLKDEISRRDMEKFINFLQDKSESKLFNIGQMGDAVNVLNDIVYIIIKENSNFSSLFEIGINIEQKRCQQCGFSPSLSFAKRKVSYLSLIENGVTQNLIQSNIEAFSKCPPCQSEIDSVITFPHFIIVRLHLDRDIYVDPEVTINNGKQYHLKLVSFITGGTGHATCYCNEDNIWTHYNDNSVTPNRIPSFSRQGIGAIYEVHEIMDEVESQKEMDNMDNSNDGESFSQVTEDKDIKDEQPVEESLSESDKNKWCKCFIHGYED